MGAVIVMALLMRSMFRMGLRRVSASANAMRLAKTGRLRRPEEKGGHEQNDYMNTSQH